MAASSARRGYYWCEFLVNQFPPPLVALLLILPIPTVTQLTFGNAPVTTLSPTPTGLLSPPFPTNSSSAATDDSDDFDDLSPGSLVNYYFLLLALLVLILLALLWTFHRRRKRKIALSRHGGHNALAQDLEGWRGNRRWAASGGGRGWRNVFSGHGQRREGRGEDHLDEGGEEAPPPYDYVAQERTRPVRVLLGRSRSRESDWPERTLGYGRDRAVGASIPLHVLDGSGGEGKPPEYGRM